MRRLFRTMSLRILCTLAGFFVIFISNDIVIFSDKEDPSAIQTTVITQSVNEQVLLYSNQSYSEILSEPIIVEENSEDKVYLSEEDIELIALVTMAEAEGECEDGKRLVIDTVLNRVDSEHFPNTVYAVIYQKSQFSSMWNGRVDKCFVSDDICQLVRDELLCRSNYDVVFFTAGEYGRYGIPMFQVGNHYFASYD